MRSSIIIILAFIFSLQTFESNAQSIDQSKMDKDLEVSKNVLSSLLENASKNRFLWRFGENIDAKYQSGYGLIYSINQTGFPVIIADGVRINEPYAVGHAKVAGKVVSRTSGTVGSDQTADNNENLKEMAKDFVLNYHNLVRQLKSSDKIMVKTRVNRGRGDAYVVFSNTGERQANNLFSIEAKVSDLLDFSSGKISEKEMLDKIVEKDISSDESSEPELEVFAAAFGRMYQSDLSDSYYMTGYPWNERTEGFGVTFYLKFYSSTQVNDLYNLPTFKKSNLELSERNKVVEEAYPGFKENLKENMLDYGHLLKNLKDSEHLVFNVKLTECKDCSIPDVIELKVKKSTISQYRNGTLSLDAAKKQIEETILES